MTPLNAAGSALAVLGTYLYSRAKLREENSKAAKADATAVKSQ